MLDRVNWVVTFHGERRRENKNSRSQHSADYSEWQNQAKLAKFPEVLTARAFSYVFLVVFTAGGEDECESWQKLIIKVVGSKQTRGAISLELFVGYYNSIWNFIRNFTQFGTSPVCVDPKLEKYNEALCFFPLTPSPGERNSGSHGVGTRWTTWLGPRSPGQCLN